MGFRGRRSSISDDNGGCWVGNVGEGGYDIDDDGEDEDDINDGSEDDMTMMVIRKRRKEEEEADIRW